jgi:hypothetical protein
VDQKKLSGHLQFIEEFHAASRSFKKLHTELRRLTKEARARRRS